MILDKVFIEILLLAFINTVVIADKNDNSIDIKQVNKHINNVDDYKLANVFNGVYTDCFMHLSYSCLQRKTLIYLKELNKLSEVSVIGDYVKFVKLNPTDADAQSKEEVFEENNSEELSIMIDQAIDKFFDNHIIKFSALGRNISVPNTVEGFVGRKKRKGGGGGGGGHGSFGHDDGGKKKMMMMAMMCMKMKLMMMVPAMMGMMGMMSFKGMMFSMMSFMISKMMLLMKILEKKGLGGGSGGGGDGGWAAGGGGGGAWMPAGGQDYGGGGGYDANGQWQSRAIIDKKDMKEKGDKDPIISYVMPTLRYNTISVKATDMNKDKKKSRKRRGIMDALQNVYLYWLNQVFGAGNRRKSNNQRYKIVNGVKYVYYPNKFNQKVKVHQANNIPNKVVDEFKPIIIAEDFNKGETVEGGIESRMNTKKFHKLKDTVNDTFDENPWE